MNPQELGKKLQDKREELNLSIDDIAEKIKVSARILRHIENGNIKSLPHAVYTRGFILSYGNVLNLEQGELYESLNLSYPIEDDEIKSTVDPIILTGDSGRIKRIGLIALLVLIILLVLAGGWFVVSTYGDSIIKLVKAPFSAVSVDKSNATVENIRENSGPEVVLSPPLGENANSSARFATEDPSATAAPELVTTIPAASMNASASANTMDTSESAPVNEHSLEIESIASCWTKVTIDGKVEEFTIRPGNTKNFVFEKSLEVTFGNPTGVRLKYNGKDFNDKLKTNKPVTLRFPS